MNPTDTYTVAVSLMGIEIMALKKLTLISHALADKLTGSAGAEQKALARCLEDLVRQIELKAQP